jgi:hypothetical protein
MTSIDLGRALAGCGAWQSSRGIGQGHPINGRQGKSAASGRAHMVGWLEFQGPLNDHAGWRFKVKPQRFQGPDRSRRRPEAASAP